MSTFCEMKPTALNENVFQLIRENWMLITAQKEDKVNTMTASWGGMGVMWGKEVAYIVIRPTRYTKEFVDFSNSFSLTFFNQDFKSKLNYLGSVSGREEDKIKKTGLTVLQEDSIPYFEEGKLVLLCKTLYTQALHPDGFLDTSLDMIWYPQKDYHTLYIAEIEKILVKTH